MLMKSPNLLFRILLTAAVTVSLQGCFTLSNMSTGRTLGKGHHEIVPAVSSVYVDRTLSAPILPQVFYNYGLTERLDLGASVSLGTVGIQAKYQIAGNQQSAFCMAPGVSFTYFGMKALVSSGSGSSTTSDTYRVSVSNLSLLLNTSWHHSDNFAIFLSPRFTMLAGSTGWSGSGSSSTVRLVGVTPGVEIGRRLRFVVEGNLVTPLEPSDRFPGFFGMLSVGMKFRVE